MQKRVPTLVVSLVLGVAQCVATVPFGHLVNFSINIGDDIQSIAARAFLPLDRIIGINREFMPQAPVVNAIMNGWYMNTKKYGWYPKDIPAPDKSWPPAPHVNPLLISMHFTRPVLGDILSDEGIAYLKKHGPVGARDFYTLDILQSNGIPAYFSGCLTLTLQNDGTKRDDIIYVVDLDDTCVKYIQARTTSRVERLTHFISNTLSRDQDARLVHAHRLLEKYKRAKCVVTSKLHAALPNLAFQTPVLLINTQKDQYRFAGLKELVCNGSKRNFLDGKINFDFNNPPANPTTYLPLRQQLIDTVTAWVKAQG